MRFRTAGVNWEGRAWTLVPCLVVLGEQVSSLHPERHPADGTVASKSHDAANPTSDHRPTPHTGPGKVRGLDFGENTENDVFDVLETIRLSRDPRVKYVIHERRLFSSYPSGLFDPYEWRPYTGPAPHTNHGHVSTLPEGDNDTSLWAITKKEEPMSLLPVSAESSREDIRHCQEMLQVTASGQWDFVNAVRALAQRSGTGDPKGSAGEWINGRMYTHLLGEFTRRSTGGGGSQETIDVRLVGRLLG